MYQLVTNLFAKDFLKSFIMYSFATNLLIIILAPSGLKGIKDFFKVPNLFLLSVITRSINKRQTVKNPQRAVT